MNKLRLEHRDVERMAFVVSQQLAAANMWGKRCYPIPRGGVPAAYLVSSIHEMTLVESPEQADFFLDDIIDSGETMRKFCDEYPGRPFFALVDKTITPALADKWIIFPWEGNETGSIEDNIRRMMQFIGEDVTREGLLETPARVAKAWKHWFSGYGKNPADVLKVFEDGAENYDQMVLVKDIPIYSHCEHHIAAIIGTCSIAYIPNGKIVGLSKLSRLADMFARRLQVQERLTSEIADALEKHLQPKGVGVVITARHLCMESRGVCQQGHVTITSALRGVLRDDTSARAEFMSLVK